MEQRILTFLDEELKRRFGSKFTIKRKEQVGGGCISHTLKLKTTYGDFFLKWNPSCADDLFVREAECLNELKKHSGGELYIPEVLFASHAHEPAGFILLEYLHPGISSKQDERLGHGLARLHQIQGEQYGFYHDNYCGSTLQMNSWKSSWTTFFIENRLMHILQQVKQSRFFDVEDQKAYDKLILKLPELISNTAWPSLIHGDLWSGNYLYTTLGPALIDPASCYADREMEFSIMAMFGGFSSTTWDAYQEIFPFESGWEERIQLYQLYHILNHYYLFGGAYGRQAISLVRKFI